MLDSNDTAALNLESVERRDKAVDVFERHSLSAIIATNVLLKPGHDHCFEVLFVLPAVQQSRAFG